MSVLFCLLVVKMIEERSKSLYLNKEVEDSSNIVYMNNIARNNNTSGSIVN